jgi:hypothetical protein
MRAVAQSMAAQQRTSAEPMVPGRAYPGQERFSGILPRRQSMNVGMAVPRSARHLFCFIVGKHAFG